MTYRVRLLGAARRDVDKILEWLNVRSRRGARSWYDALRKALNTLVEDPERHPFAPESEILGRPMRQFVFKTRQGNRYRLVFLVETEDVFVLRVRGPSQDLLELSDLPI